MRPRPAQRQKGRASCDLAVSSEAPGGDLRSIIAQQGNRPQILLLAADAEYNGTAGAWNCFAWAIARPGRRRRKPLAFGRSYVLAFSPKPCALRQTERSPRPAPPSRADGAVGSGYASLLLHRGCRQSRRIESTGVNRTSSAPPPLFVAARSSRHRIRQRLPENRAHQGLVRFARRNAGWKYPTAEEWKYNTSCAQSSHTVFSSPRWVKGVLQVHRQEPPFSRIGSAEVQPH